MNRDLTQMHSSEIHTRLNNLYGKVVLASATKRKEYVADIKALREELERRKANG